MPLPISKTQTALIAIVIANVIFGLSSVFYKVGLQSIRPLIFSFYRQLFAWPLLVVIAYFTDRRMIQRQHWGWFILVAFLGVYLNQMFFTFGVHYAGAVLASVGQLATPPVTSILAVIFKMEKFSWMRLAGVALSIVGAFVLLGLDQIDLSSDRTIGIVILLVQSLWVASFFLLQKAKLLEHYPPITVTTGMYVAGMPFMAITAFIIEPIENFAIDLSGFGVWTIAYAVIAQSIIAYFLLAYANSNMESSIVAAFGPINPLSATIAAVILLGEAIGPQEVIGSLIILGGLALVTYQRHLESLAQKALAAETPVTVAVESVAESTTTEATDSATNDGSDEANDTDDPEVSGDESNMVQLDEFTLSNPSSPTPLLAHDGAHHKELHAVVAAERDFEEKSTPQGAHS